MLKLVRNLAPAMIALLFTTNVFANGAETQSARIIGYNVGWNNDAIAVWIAAPEINPARCSNNGYIMAQSVPGYKTMAAAVMTAYAADSKIRIVIHKSECLYSRPMIIGITSDR